MDPGKAFLTDLITGQHEETNTGQNDDDRDNDPVDNDGSLSSSTSLNNLAGRYIFRNLDGCPDDVNDTMAVNQDSENHLQMHTISYIFDRILIEISQGQRQPSCRPKISLTPPQHHDSP